MAEYQAIFKRTLEKANIYVIGLASDGDARRAGGQLSQYSVFLNKHLSIEGKLLYCDLHDSLEFAPRARSEEKEGGKFKLPPVCLHQQDPKHNLKKLFRILFSSRHPVLGKYAATLNHAQAVFDSGGDHRLHANDCCPQDRQSVGTPTRVSGYRVIDALVRLEQEGKEANVLGTRTVLEMLADYQSIFFSTKATVEDRIEKASYIMNFLRLWSWSVQQDGLLDLATNFYSQQTYRHVILSLHTAIYLVCVTRDYCPEMSIFEALRSTGSDICERTFSMVGGFGRYQSGKRNFTFEMFVSMLEKQGVVEGLLNKGGGLAYRSAMKKGEWDERLHDREPGSPKATPPTAGEFPADSDMTALIEAGLARAQKKAIELGMVIAKPNFDRPWENNEALTSEMRDDAFCDRVDSDGAAWGVAANGDDCSSSEGGKPSSQPTGAEVVVASEPSVPDPDVVLVQPPPLAAAAPPSSSTLGSTSERAIHKPKRSRHAGTLASFIKRPHFDLGQRRSLRHVLDNVDAAPFPVLPNDASTTIMNVLVSGKPEDYVGQPGTNFQRRDLNCMFSKSEGYCLTTAVMDTYIRFLNQEVPKVNPLHHQLLPDSYQVQKLIPIEQSAGAGGVFGAGTVGFHEYCTKTATTFHRDVSHLDVYSVTVHRPGHWYRMDLDVKAKICTVHDSFELQDKTVAGNEYNANAARHVLFVCEYYKWCSANYPGVDLLWHPGHPDDWTATLDTTYPQQRQEGDLGHHNDCGAFVLAAHKAVAHGLDPSRCQFVCQENMLRIRMGMALELTTWQLRPGAMHRALPRRLHQEVWTVEDDDADATEQDDDMADLLQIGLLTARIATKAAVASAEAAAAATALPSAPKSSVREACLPGTDRTASITSLLQVFTDCKAGHYGSLVNSNDRLTRITQISKRVNAIAEGSVATDGDMLELFSCYAFNMFDDSTKRGQPKTELWFGRVQKMWSPTQKAFTDQTRPVPLLASKSGKMEVSCNWFTRAWDDSGKHKKTVGKEKRPAFKYGVTQDTERYSMACCVGLVHFQREPPGPDGKVMYTMLDHVRSMRRFKALAAGMVNSARPARNNTSTRKQYTSAAKPRKKQKKKM